MIVNGLKTPKRHELISGHFSFSIPSGFDEWPKTGQLALVVLEYVIPFEQQQHSIYHVNNTDLRF